MKTAIVTGASGNLGRVIIEKFLQENYQVIGTVPFNDVNPINIDHTNFKTAELDLLDEKQSSEFIHTTLGLYKTIDVAILTVGGFAMGTVADTDTSSIMHQVQLNFSTAYNIARPVFQQMMQQQYGRIFMIGSRPGLHSFHGNGMVAYSLGKSLLFRLAELMNDEAKGLNVVTSIVVPSTIDTIQNRLAMPDADPSKWVKPSDIANIISYHCSDEAAALRETVIKVYGNS